MTLPRSIADREGQKFVEDDSDDVCVRTKASADTPALPSGAATSAKQLADGHNVTVDNIAGAGVYIRPGTGEVFPVSATNLDIRDLSSASDSVAAAQSGAWTFGSSITGINHGVKAVSSAGTDEALAASTACKRVTVQAQTDNTGWIAVGTSGVDATEATGTGVLLGSGDAYELEIDNLADIYIDATVDGEGVRYSYFT